jgi:hypothetical protein
MPSRLFLWDIIHKTPFVIASEAKQSRLGMRATGLLRCARNDETDPSYPSSTSSPGPAFTKRLARSKL